MSHLGDTDDMLARQCTCHCGGQDWALLYDTLLGLAMSNPQLALENSGESAQ